MDMRELSKKAYESAQVHEPGDVPEEDIERAFFIELGEVEAAEMGLDDNTGALFVYKNGDIKIAFSAFGEECYDTLDTQHPGGEKFRKDFTNDPALGMCLMLATALPKHAAARPGPR